MNDRKVMNTSWFGRALVNCISFLFLYQKLPKPEVAIILIISTIFKIKHLRYLL